MKKNILRILCLVLCLTLCFGGIVAAYAAGSNTAPEQITVSGEEPQTPEETDGTEKNETVYVLAGADGSVKKIIVSDWVRNTLSQDSLSDRSELTGIENVKGDEGYVMGGDHTTVWDARGNDIYYQGNIDKELPVALKVSYTLDGEAIAADQIAGKSGRVTVRFDYENRQSETVVIDGKEETVYVPFVMLTGMLLDGEHFRNIQVSNGKLLNDGERTAVIGLAFPGLQSDLGIGKDVLDLPDFVEISADVTDFEFGMTVTVATNEIVNRIEQIDLSSADELSGSMGELIKGMDQLIDGSSSLYTGLAALLDKSEELVAGIGQLAEGAKALKDGAVAVDDGAEALQNGAKELTAGLKELKENNASLTNGAKQIFDTMLTTARTELQNAGLTVPVLTAENYAEELNKIIQSLDQKSVYEQVLAQVTAAVEQNRSAIKEKVTKTVWAQIDPEVAETVRKEVNRQIDETVETQIRQLIAESMASNEVQTQLSNASEDARPVMKLKASLDGVNSFYLGLILYTGGVTSAAQGAETIASGCGDLKTGTAQLAAGAEELYGGILQMKNGTPALIDGVSQLKNGSMQLTDGLKKFREEGIQKIVSFIDEDLNGVVSRLKATVEVSKRYRNFSGIADGTDGQVKFIYRTDEIRK